MTELFPEQVPSAASSDLCRRGQPLSAARVLLMTLCFIIMFCGAVSLLFISDQLFLAIASVVTDTAAVILYTFSANKNGMRPFMFSCPVVRRALPQLVRRHLGFLTALVVLQFAAFRVRAYLPTWWTTADGTNWTPFTVVLVIGVGCLALMQVFSNRSLLDSAHEPVGGEATG